MTDPKPLEHWIPGPEAHGSLKNALERAVAEVAPAPDAQQSTDLTTRNLATMQDLMPLPSYGSDPNAGIFPLPSSIAGVALTGFLAPGDMVLLAPTSTLQQLQLRVAAESDQSANGNPLVNWLLSSIGQTSYAGANLHTNGPTLPSDCVLLRAGESVNFGRVLGDSLVGMFINTGPGHAQDAPPSSAGGHVGGIWPVTYPTNTGANFGIAVPQYVNAGRIFGPTSRPILRVFREASAVPRSVDYTKVPWSGYSPIITSAGAIGSPNLPSSQRNIWYPTRVLGQGTLPNGCYTIFPPGVGWTTLSLNAINSSISGVPFFSLADSGAAPFDVNVYWLLNDGIWHLNPLDQWVTTARGQASASHDVEVYETPQNALGVAITTISPLAITAGYVPFMFVSCTEG